jgi:histidine triad (HIT) family protein
MDDIFCKIAKREIPKEFAYEDDDVMVFADINPLKPIHLLIVPKKHVTEFVAVEDSALFVKIFDVVKKMINENLKDKPYRIVINGGGAQVIDHFHVHLLGPMDRKAKM